MLYRMLSLLDRIFSFERASAHCDIPCGIYDPIAAQISALTVIRMIDLMEELNQQNHKNDLEYHNTMVRYICVKEEHAEKCKHEIRIIWGDYFKSQHHETHPGLMALTDRIMKLGSECKQFPNREKAVVFLEQVNHFAEIFWQTKGIKTKRAKAPYDPREELVYPAL